MRRYTRLVGLGPIFAASALLAVGLPMAGAARSGAARSGAQGRGMPRITVPGSHPVWAARSRQVSAAAAGPVRLQVYLAGHDGAGLTAFATAVSTPGNPSYRKFLTPAQVLRRFGPNRAQVRSVRAWLSSSGLRITSVQATGAAGAYVAAAGSLAAAGRAFHVSFRTYRGPDGRSDRAPARAATIPARVAGAVLAVSGLDSARYVSEPSLLRLDAKLPPPGPNGWRKGPCSHYFGQRVAYGKPRAGGRHWPWAICGYRPSQIRGAYHVTASGMTGAGQTVAIVDAYRSPTLLADANRYARLTGDPQFRPGQFTIYQTGRYTQLRSCGAQGWYGEQTLDVEALHGMAPAAKVRFVAAGSCGNADLLEADALVVNRHLASIVSDSWSNPADEFGPAAAAADRIFKLGAAEGIGFYFSTGDHGYNAPDETPASARSNRIQVSYPSSSPWVTAVGGTSLAIGRNQRYLFETSWGSIIDPLQRGGRHWEFPPPGEYPRLYNGSGGGGVSVVYRQPAYQAGVVPTGLATHLPDGKVSPGPMRVIPDVSAVADPATGLLVGQTTLQPNGRSYAFALAVVGGTSLACPVFAAIEADAQQAVGHVLGFANPLIYARYGTSAFRDVTDHPRGSGMLHVVDNAFIHPSLDRGAFVTLLDTLGINGEGAAALRAVPGYDDVTGVGSPNRYIQSFGP